MARLVAVDVLADQAGDVFDVGVASRIDLLVEHLRRASRSASSSPPMSSIRPRSSCGMIPRVLPGIALGEVAAVPAARGSKGSRNSPIGKRALTKPSANRSCCASSLRACRRSRRDVLRYPSTRAMRAMVQSSKAYSSVFEAASPRGRPAHSRASCKRRDRHTAHRSRSPPSHQRGLGVEAANPLHVGVGDHRHGVIADHAPGLDPLELPHRQDAVTDWPAARRSAIHKIVVARCSGSIRVISGCSARNVSHSESEEKSGSLRRDGPGCPGRDTRRSRPCSARAPATLW